MCMCVRVCACVCVYVSLYVYMIARVHMYICTAICMHGYLYMVACMDLRLCIFMHRCKAIWMHACLYSVFVFCRSLLLRVSVFRCPLFLLVVDDVDMVFVVLRVVVLLPRKQRKQRAAYACGCVYMLLHR